MKYGEVKLFNGQIVDVHWDDGDGIVPAEEYKKVKMYGILWDYVRINSLKSEIEKINNESGNFYIKCIVEEALSLITEAYYKAQTIFDKPHEPAKLKWEV